MDASQVVALSQQLEDPAALTQSLEADIRDGGRRLARLVANVDGMQLSGNRVQTAAHASSALFNAMRGGVFADDHRLPLGDLAEFIAHRNHETAARNREFFSSLGDRRDSRPIEEVQAAAEATADPDLVRLVLEYLPLWFSRRHGDPSRPWNQFAIRLTNPDGSRRLDWEGNWRDIFQNWEALCTSFPAFALGTVITFVDASSADGGNPYRITRSGLDWEVPDPDDPWSEIGYWGDHQIIYLLRLLELTRRVQPGRLEPLLDRKLFTYADIPYRIAPYEALLVDPHSTIQFDQAAHNAIVEREAKEGADARLLRDESGELVRVTLAEKLLVPLLSKLCNLVVDGGIWMNTHRPEWNDANNALVGWGLSVVTAAHLRRYCVFLESLLADHTGKTFQLSDKVATWLEEACSALAEHQHHLTARRSVDDTTRQLILDDLGEAFSRYRDALYGQGLGAEEVDVPVQQVTLLLGLARQYLEHTLEANRRSDGLYHGYNVLVPRRSGTDTSSALGLTRLPLMLEGQVAVLDSGHIGPAEASAMLDVLFASDLYREDQHSFVLYPPIERPGFLARNRVQPDTARQIPLLQKLLDAGDTSIVRRDAQGDIRFHGDLANAADLETKLDELAKSRSVSPSDKEAILALWEDTFEHRKFTGRSSTMYAYEGIGSIYWHMVSKLQLAVASLHEVARAEAPELVPRLAAHYHAIRDGLGPAKSPALQGAFPTDPHSHTPAHRGAQQPGMTGQAKEAVLVRWHELGVFVKDGHVHFDPTLLPTAELLEAPAALTVPMQGDDAAVAVPAGGVAFTFCQVPIVYVAEKERQADGSVNVQAHWLNGGIEESEASLDAAASTALLGRTGELERVEVRFPRGRLWSRSA